MNIACFLFVNYRVFIVHKIDYNTKRKIDEKCRIIDDKNGKRGNI